MNPGNRQMWCAPATAYESVEEASGNNHSCQENGAVQKERPTQDFGLEDRSGKQGKIDSALI